MKEVRTPGVPSFPLLTFDLRLAPYGCSSPAAESEISEGSATLGPAPNVNP